MRKTETYVLLNTVTCVLTIALTSANQETPVLKDIKYSIYEELNPLRKLVGNILEDASIIITKQQPSQQVSCSILSKDSEYQDYFELEKETGALWTAKRIDREEICPYKDRCSMTLTVAVELSTLVGPQIVKVHVEIMDTNDNSPTFPAPAVALALPESYTPGMSLNIPGADDRDSPRFGIRDYKLDGEYDNFELKFHNNKEDVADLKLVLKQKLDREEKDFYSIRVLAKDAGSPTNVGFLTVNITVLDTNDNAPMFNNTEYHFVTPEDKPISSVLGRVLATDPDDGQNGAVTYSFEPKTQKAYGDFFGIEAVTGVIYLRGNLDFETKQSYQLSIIARDQGPIPLMTYAKVVIAVQDVNDHAPEIKVNTLSSRNVAIISEFRRIGLFVAHVVTSDPDMGVNGEHSCSLDSNFFKLRTYNNKNEYEIVSIQIFDRKKKKVPTATLR